MAYTATRDPDQNFIALRDWIRQVAQHEGIIFPVQVMYGFEQVSLHRLRVRCIHVGGHKLVSRITPGYFVKLQ
jgi:hypothetical protein